MSPIYKVACAIVLYRPEREVLENLNTYYNSVDLLIAVDNSEQADPLFRDELLKRFPKVRYKAVHENLGIAAALNLAAHVAIGEECGWMLTMDQDSSFKAGEPGGMIQRISEAESKFSNIGIISPYHVLHGAAEVETSEPYSEKSIVMTSGNLLNLRAYEVAGDFREELFMDYVDYEYCLRLRKSGFRIIQDNTVRLTHALGAFEIKKVLYQNIGVSHHNATRRYYMSRNSLSVGFKYRKTDARFFLNTLKNIVFWDPFRIVLFEKNKISKLRSLYRGAFHFLINRYGKIR